MRPAAARSLDSGELAGPRSKKGGCHVQFAGHPVSSCRMWPELLNTQPRASAKPEADSLISPCSFAGRLLSVSSVQT